MTQPKPIRTFAALLLMLIVAMGAAGTRIDFIGGTTGTTDNAVLRADGTGGLTAQSSACSISDNGCLKATGATITASEPVLNATQTWNAAGTTFTGMKLNVTNTASASGSMVADFQLGGTSLFNIGKDASLNMQESGATYDSILPTGSGGIVFKRSGTIGSWIYPGDGRYQMRSDGYIGWSSGTNPVTGGDTGLARNAAGDVKFTDTGSTTYATIGKSGLSGAQSKALTESAATAFVQLAVASGTHVGGRVHYTLVANDGTDYQTRSGSFNFALVNKAGAETANLGTVSAEAAAITTGTLTVSFDTDTSPTNAVNFRANATSSLTQTTLTIRYWVEIDGPAVTVTPQ